MNNLIETFETVKCTVFVIDTLQDIFEERVYCLISIRRKDGSKNIRFGNKTQIDCMRKEYVRTRT